MATHSASKGSKVLRICQHDLMRLGCWYLTMAFRQALGSRSEPGSLEWSDASEGAGVAEGVVASGWVI